MVTVLPISSGTMVNDKIIPQLSLREVLHEDNRLMIPTASSVVEKILRGSGALVQVVQRLPLPVCMQINSQFTVFVSTKRTATLSAHAIDEFTHRLDETRYPPACDGRESDARNDKLLLRGRVYFFHDAGQVFS